MNPRTSPSGVFAAIGRFSLSAPAPYLAGVSTPIPFDRTDFLSGDGLELQAGGGVACSPGLYLVQCQFLLSASPVLLISAVGVVSGSAGDEAGMRQANANSGTLVGNALRLASETPLSPTVFASVIASINGSVNAGNIDSATLLVQRLSAPPG